MGTKASKLVLISAGAALAWFLDPVSGSDRRRQIADRLSGLTGGTAAPGRDPTGGAVPPAVSTTPPPVATAPPAAVQPPPVSDPGLRADFDLPPQPDLAQAVEAATGGEKVLRSPGDGAEGDDQSRATLRATQ